MNFQHALARSPLKQAVHDDGGGLTAVISQLPTGDYQVTIAVNEQPYLTEIVQNERTVEQILWERMRIRNMRFMPSQLPSPAQQPELIYELLSRGQQLAVFFRKLFPIRRSK